ncbi:MAG: peptidase S10, partial [Alphaproteobacteria bacterium]
MTRSLFHLLCLCCGLFASPTFAQEKAPPAASPYEPKSFTTEHAGTFGGERVAYRAVAGETILRDDEGKPRAAIFSVAYLRKDVKDRHRRPVTSLYNGGPGSASLWLHMGAFGPKRVALPDTPEDDGAPPYAIVDNPDTILDASDLVFIDPVDTGFSVPLGEAKAKDFFGVTEDAKSIADFIHQWLDDNGRWNAPLYILGESYGTLRTGAVLKELASRRHGIGLNGVVLLSAVLDYQMSRFRPGNIMSYVSFLPSYAATAWYHDKLPDKPADLEAFLDEVREFARNDYARALIAGTRLAPDERKRIIERLHRYTGLDTGWLDKANLRIHVFRFFKELRRDDKLVVGRLDSRYTGIEPDAVGEFFETDPFSAAVGDGFIAAVRDYFAHDLGIRMDRRYKPSSERAGREWNWVEGER